MARKKRKVAKRKIKAASVIKKKDGTLPPSEVWNQAQDFLAAASKLDGSALRVFVVEVHEEVFGDEPKTGSTTNVIRARIGSELQYRGFKDAGCVRLLSSRFLKNRKALHTWNLNALDSRLRDLIEVGETNMASKKKSSRKSGNTITSLIISIMRKRMGTNQEVVAQVAKSFPDSKWATDTAPSLLAWHKSQFQLGNLTGQTKMEKIDQPDTGRAKKAAAKKASSKKVARKASSKKVARKSGRKKVARKK